MFKILSKNAKKQQVFTVCGEFEWQGMEELPRASQKDKHARILIVTGELTGHFRETLW